MKRVVAITGGIGSGKSVVSRLLEVMGYAVYDADSRARELMASSPAIRSGVVSLFGADLYGGQGLDRKRLGNIVFKDNTLLQKLNALVHPVVRDDFREWGSDRSDSLLFIESAILFESGFRSLVDTVWCVVAPETMRIERVVRRNGLSSEAVRFRMAAQMDETEKAALSDAIIRNDGDTPLIPQINRLLAQERDRT